MLASGGGLIFFLYFSLGKIREREKKRIIKLK